MPYSISPCPTSSLTLLSTERTSFFQLIEFEETGAIIGLFMVFVKFILIFVCQVPKLHASLGQKRGSN